MYTKNKNIIAIIPARGGSKGIIKKNIKNLSGKPLISYTIKNALKSKCIDKLFVSTDDREIAEISEKFNVKVPFLRPKKLAKDNTPTSEMILYVLKQFEKKKEFYDIVVLLQPTSPLRKNDDIDNAINLFIDNYNKADSLVSVGEVHMENPFIIKKIESGFVSPLIEKTENFFQRQQLPKVYFPYGVIYLSKVDMFKKYKTFYQKRTIPYFIERWQNYEIDDIYDFLIVERILKYKKEERKI